MDEEAYFKEISKKYLREDSSHRVYLDDDVLKPLVTMKWDSKVLLKLQDEVTTILKEQYLMR